MRQVLITAGFACLAAFSLMGSTSPAEAASCGGENQRPCKIWERIPSCNSGLYEDFGRGRCLRKAVPGRDCGRQNQRACKVWERIPSCNKGLVEALGRGICVSKARAGIDCGNENQRPCTVLERIPSCNPRLKEDFIKGKCVPDYAAIAQPYLAKTASQRRALGTVLSCMNNPSRIASLRAAANSRNSAAARQATDPCLTLEVRRALADPSDGTRFRTLSIGVGAGAQVVGGGTGEIGIVISLEGRSDNDTLRFYASGGYSVGLGLGAGADVIVGASQDALQTGISENWSINFAGKFIAGGGVAVVFNYDGSEKSIINLKSTSFNGIAISAGIGVAVDIGSKHRSRTEIFGERVREGAAEVPEGTFITPGHSIRPVPVTSGPSVTFYQHCNFQGYAVTVPAGHHSLRSLIARGIQNNDVSSMRVSPGSRVRLFVNDGMRGHYQDFDRDVPCLVDHRWNDIMSSAIVFR